MGMIEDGVSSTSTNYRNPRKCLSRILACVFICSLYIMWYRPLGVSDRESLPDAQVYSTQTSASTPRRLINFLPLSWSSEMKSWKDLVKGKELNRRETVSLLTDAMQKHMEHFQSNASCKGETLHCGHSKGCGLGCQIHHRAVCVLMSYIMGIPLIHDAATACPNETPWAEVYRELGSSCKENEKTIYILFKSRERGPPIMHFDKLCNLTTRESCPFPKQFEYPLTNGVPIPKDLFEILEANHDDPFLWYVGQFMKYAIRYSSKMERLLQETETSLGFKESEHVLGAHIRRTDKIYEDKDSHHELGEYMNWTEAYFQANHFRDFLHRAVFIASDDHLVIEEARSSYTAPLWKLLSLESDQMFRDEKERQSGMALKTIVQDIHFLAKCEYVICGLTSNVCRLVLELLATRFPEIWSRIKAVDGVYDLVLQGATPPKLLIPV